MGQLSSIRRVRIVPLLLGLVVLGATVALKLGVGASDAAVSPTMHAAVHSDDSITLSFDDGSAIGSQARDVPTVPAGTYTIRVVDDATDHNFHLAGPGVNEATGVGETGTPTWTVTIQPGGIYRFQCDAHADFMFGVFQGAGGSSGSSGGSSSGASSTGSTSVSSSSSSSGGSDALAFRGTLAGTVGADGTAQLLFRGKPVSRLESGRYKITVVDRTAAHGFVVQQSRHSPIAVSGVPFVGTHSVTVVVAVGQWSFATSAGRTSKRSFVVVA